MISIRFQLMLLICCFGHVAWAADTNSISEEEFTKLHKEIDTPKGKPWRSIPWKVSLLETQNEAAKSNKPIFIWAMDGHPLGCT